MVYQEIISIPNNKAKRILELCKSLGIELYDSYNSRRLSNISTGSKKTINAYLVEYYRWSNLTKEHLENIFLTPRIAIEFSKRDVFGTTFEMNIQSHLDNVLAQQIYFVERVISEIKKYKYSERASSNKRHRSIPRLFSGNAKTTDA